MKNKKTTEYINDKKKWNKPKLMLLDFKMTETGSTVNVDNEENNYQFSVLS
jgi:hypothetical protein